MSELSRTIPDGEQGSHNIYFNLKKIDCAAANADFLIVISSYIFKIKLKGGF